MANSGAENRLPGPIVPCDPGDGAGEGAADEEGDEEDEGDRTAVAPTSPILVSASCHSGLGSLIAYTSTPLQKGRPLNSSMITRGESPLADECVCKVYTRTGFQAAAARQFWLETPHPSPPRTADTA